MIVKVNNFQYGKIKVQFTNYILSEKTIDSKHKELDINNTGVLQHLGRTWDNIKRQIN